MSRTDKDTPWWTRAVWWVPSHNLNCRFGYADCSLPADPERARDKHRWSRGTGCYWWPESDVHPFPAPAQWYVDHVYHNPQRVKVRDGGRRMVAEYRASGVVEWEVLPVQGRRSAYWSWW